MNVTVFDIAMRFTGVREMQGALSNPQILAMLQLDTRWPADDSVPWCSAFVNYCCWLLRLPRSKDLRARSWLQVGRPISGRDLVVGWDVVIIKRSASDVGPEVIEAAGHVGFYAGLQPYPPEPIQHIFVLGGNQSDAVNVSAFPVDRILGLRRLLEP